MNEKKPTHSSPRPWIAGVLVLIGVACLATVAIRSCQASREEARYEALRQAARETETATMPATEAETEAETETETETREEIIYCDAVIDFDEAHETNEDIYAWIQVPGTAVDYPVLQHEEDNYYLMHNLNGSEGYPGCIYTNASAGGQDFAEKISILYGHNLTRDRMFGSLHNYEDKEFFEEYRNFYIYTETNRFTYEVIAAVYYSDDSIPYYYDVDSFEGVEAFWQSILACDFENEPSYVLEGTELTEEDQLTVLSTCIRQNGKSVEGRRYLIVGRLIETAVYQTGLDGTTKS
jgi:sortase B